MKIKPVLGQTLYSLNVGNAARGNPQILTPVTVTKVGRKYFECRKEGRIFGTRYFLDTWLEDAGGYCRNSQLYETEQEWLDEKEKAELGIFIKNMFSRYGSITLSLEALRKIKDIIDSENKPAQS